MKLEWALLCRKGLVDRDSGLPSLIDVFFRVTIPAELAEGSALPMDFAVVTRWIAEPEERVGASVAVELRMLAGRKVLARISEDFISSPSGVHTSMTRFNLVPVIGDQLTFEIHDMHKNRRAGRLNLMFDRQKAKHSPSSN